MGTVALAGLCRSPLRVRTLSASRSVCCDPWSRVITLPTEQEVVHLIRIRLTRKGYTARCKAVARADPDSTSASPPVPPGQPTHEFIPPDLTSSPTGSTGRAEPTSMHAHHLSTVMRDVGCSSRDHHLHQRPCLRVLMLLSPDRALRMSPLFSGSSDKVTTWPSDGRSPELRDGRQPDPTTMTWRL